MPNGALIQKPNQTKMKRTETLFCEHIFQVLCKFLVPYDYYSWVWRFQETRAREGGKRRHSTRDEGWEQGREPSLNLTHLLFQNNCFKISYQLHRQATNEMKNYLGKAVFCTQQDDEQQSEQHMRYIKKLGHQILYKFYFITKAKRHFP